MNILKALFGNYSKKELKRIQPICDKVLALEDKYAAMSESELKIRQLFSKSVLQTAKLQMTSYRMPLLYAERVLGVYLV